MSKKQINIQFKPEFELKLKRLRIKSKFIKELRAYLLRVGTESAPGPVCLHATECVDITTWRTIDSAIYLNKLKYWRTFIARAFDWTETKDGYQYWNEILKR